MGECGQAVGDGSTVVHGLSTRWPQATSTGCPQVSRRPVPRCARWGVRGEGLPRARAGLRGLRPPSPPRLRRGPRRGAWAAPRTAGAASSCAAGRGLRGSAAELAEPPRTRATGVGLGGLDPPSCTDGRTCVHLALDLASAPTVPTQCRHYDIATTAHMLLRRPPPTPPTTPTPPTHANPTPTTTSQPTTPANPTSRPPPPPTSTRQPPPPPGYPKRYLRALAALILASRRLKLPLDQALTAIAPGIRKATFFEYRRAATLYLQMTGRPAHAEHFAKIQRPKSEATKTKRRTIAFDDVKALATAAEKRGDYALNTALELSWKYGLRAAELSSVEVVGNELRVKGAKRTASRGSDRTIVLGEKAAQRLGRRVELLKSENAEALRMRLYRLCKELYPRRQPVTFHRVRHQVASDLKAQGVEITEIAKLLGHRSCKSTNGYGDPRRGKGSATRARIAVKAEHEPKPLKSAPPARIKAPQPGG